ncbi:unnamed protein product [Chrysodeixis includens]|uniref:TIL domain-containing protein n=1 Tax=Chrysodeixis includens TaxID=689277 RepID=A0A9N8L143_CHRIL|nr:unnamed protein product [Chrysodeixis includens]
MLTLFIVLFSCYTVLCHEVNNIGVDSTSFDNCRADEEWRCIEACPGEHTCNDRYNRTICTDSDYLKPCLPMCICKHPKYLRAVNGTCITDEECDKLKCPGANEYPSCSLGCDVKCATLGEPNCVRQVCEPGCFCDEGFARDADGNCIPIENCAEYSGLWFRNAKRSLSSTLSYMYSYWDTFIRIIKLVI